MPNSYQQVEDIVFYFSDKTTLKESVHLAAEILFRAANRSNDKRTKKYLEVLGNDVAKMTGEVRE